MQFFRTFSSNPQTYPLQNHSRSFSSLGTRAEPEDFDIVGRFGLLKSRASDRDTISDKETLYYKFRLDRTSKVRMKLENRLEKDAIAGFFQDRSLFGRFVDADGRKLSSDSDSARPEETVTLNSRSLKPGTYYLRLKSNYSKKIDYRIELKRL